MRKHVKYYALIIFGLPMLYFVFAFILGHTPIHNGFKPDTAGVEIFVKSNGAHTDFVLPISNGVYNWSAMVSTENTVAKDTAMQFVAMGWGNKDFFLNTPEWSDLKLSTAFNALFTPSDAAMHVSFRKTKPKIGEECKAVMISREQYTVLVLYIQNSFVKERNGKVIQIAVSIMETMTLFSKPTVITTFLKHVMNGQEKVSATRK